MRFTLPFTLLLALALLAGSATRALGQSGENVLLVINADSPVSVEIGAYYAEKRALPDQNIVRLKAPTTESISRADFERTIEAPLGAWISRRNLQDQILYVVLTKGVPLRVSGTGGRDGTVASVDSELTLLYRKLLGQPAPVIGRVVNPLFLDDKPPADAKPVTRFSTDLYLVTRLDGFTVADVKGLVDRSLAASNAGAFVLDQKATVVDRGGDSWLEIAAERLATRPGGNKVVLEKTRAVAGESGPVLGYFSWGSNDPANQLRRTGLTFSPGAIGGTFVSTDARTFVEPPATWKPSVPSGGPVFRGSFQSLIGDLIRDGLTGVSGHVEEPYLDAIVRPQVLFPTYAAGFNLAESYYLSIPFLSWQTVVIGDPLCQPFSGSFTRADVEKGIDPDTELPALFSERRMALLNSGGLNPVALKLLLRKDSRLARGEPVDVEEALTQATTLESRLAIAHLQLAAIFDGRKEYDKAIDRYRRILAHAPDDFVALNNLAYALAEYAKAPKEALPHAERAYRLSRQSPVVTDTLGWIHHRLGDNITAAAYLEQALRGAPGHADILIHAATVHLALGDDLRARAEIAAAEKLGASVTEREDFKALRSQISRP